MEKKHAAKSLPGGLYADGKKCPTLTRVKNSVEVQIRGKRGRAAKKTVGSSPIKKIQTEHFTCVSEPGGSYLTHVTPEGGTGRAIAREMVDLVRERNIDLVVMGMDGTSVNTGVHNGVIRLTELELGIPVQHIICLLHMNELPLRHIFYDLDGVTAGPDTFKGDLGKELSKDVWKEKVVAFPRVKGKLPDISEEQLKDTSRDQRLLYQLASALQSGNVPDKVACATIGPIMHARWLTLACRILRKGLSTKKPSKKLSTLLSFLMNFYVPAWFRIKFSPHCQSGALHFAYLVELAQGLKSGTREIVQKVLCDNPYFAHPENVVIALLADQNEELRRKGVLYILKAREEFDEDSHPRQFLKPQINLNAKSYDQLIDWEQVQSTEPPLTMKMCKEELLKGLEEPIRLPDYPCHTQSVERTVPVVTESCLQKVGYSGRHQWILSTMESRDLVHTFQSKQDEMPCVLKNESDDQ